MVVGTCGVARGCRLLKWCVRQVCGAGVRQVYGDSARQVL